MPVSQYDRYYGGNAEGALRNMVKRYGSKKGHEMFYAQVEQKRKKGLAQGRVTGARHA
jgi:hypothetical protein